MPTTNQQEQKQEPSQQQPTEQGQGQQKMETPTGPRAEKPQAFGEVPHPPTGEPTFREGRPIERKTAGRAGLRGTAAMDQKTRQEVARKGGLAVSRNRQHMAEIGKKGGLTVSKNRDHMAEIGRKGGAASRGHRG